MRVAILASFPAHVIPGIEAAAPRGHFATWLPQLSESWERAADLDLHWLVISRSLPPPEPVRWRGQSFHFLHVPQKLRMFRLYQRDCRLIRARLDALRPDLVHAWGTEDCYGLAAVRAGRPFLLSMQGILTEYERRVRLHPFERFQAILERFVLRRTRQITSESTWGCATVRKLAPQAEVTRIEYGVDDVFFRQPWQPDPAKPAAIFVGTPNPRKGIEDAVAAFADPALAGAELWIAGDRDNSYSAPLIQRSTPNVRWLGRLNSSETAARLAQAWCLVLPTRADTSPNAVKEARVVGLPVISTPHGGQSDYVVPGETGWLCEPGDVRALVGHLTRTLGDFALTQQLGHCRHAEHRDWFRPERTATEFHHLYQRLAS